VFDSHYSRIIQAISPKMQVGVQNIYALSDVSFEIKRGEAVALIGRNGSGKSTLLEILTGTLSPTSGEIMVNGRISALLELGSGFNPEYSGRDNVILNGLLLGLSKKEIISRFSDIEEFAEIGDAIDRPLNTYSTGMIMRLAFSVQVICNPEILIIDEALSVGDFFFQQKCLSYIRSLVDKGVTLLFVSHDMSIVRKICTRAIYLENGVKKYDGESKEAAWIYLNRQQANIKIKKDDLDQETYIYSKKENLWCNSTASLGEIHSVNISDEKGDLTDSFNIGETAFIDIEFMPDIKNPCEITVGIIDAQGRLVTATGSIQLLNQSEYFISEKYLHRYHIEIKMMLEAGRYGVEVTLCTKTGSNEALLIDKTPQIGPITINWNYLEKTAPFIGCIGLPAEGKFFKPKEI